MRRYLRFLAVGLVLGLFTEAQLKLVAGISPPAFLIALVAVVLTAAILLTPDPKAGLVIAVIGLSASYGLWSLWLLALGWKSRSAAGKGDRPVSPAS